MYSMRQAAVELDIAFPFISSDTADAIVKAYVWALHAEQEIMLEIFDLVRLKAIVWAWVAQIHRGASISVWTELDQAS